MKPFEKKRNKMMPSSKSTPEKAMNLHTENKKAIYLQKASTSAQLTRHQILIH